MALNLEELRFVVNTDSLVEATKQVGALGAALAKVNKPTSQAAIDAEKLALAQATVAKRTAEAEDASNKAALSAQKLSKAQEDSSGSAKTNVSVLEKQILILENMAQGFSKGQASIMATAKVAGALDTELTQLGETLKSQRTLQGNDPFDKSLGAIEAWSNKLKIATEMDSLYAQGLGLTRAQLKELSIEKQRLITLAEMEGKTTADAEAEYRKLIGVASSLAKQENELTAAMRSKDKALTDAGRAAAYVADADARLAAALDASNSKLDKAGSDALVKYEKNLRLMGLGSDEAAAKLAKAKTQFDAIADKKQADKLQYLARAISVQMGDVGISLASGMNPLLVMIQQGDQIRGAIQQAGASGKELEKAMAGAATQIATSFMDTAKAIGGFFVNAIKSSGKAITDFAMNITGTGQLLEKLRYQLTLMSGSDGAAMSIFKGAAAGIQILTGAIVVGAIAALVAYGVALKEVIKQESDLSKAANLSGGSLGLTTNRAQELANAFAGVKGNVGDYMGAITEAAKAGNITSNNLQTVTSAAINLNKAAGVSIESTVKEFSKLADKPTTALIDLAKTTGLIDSEILKVVDSLERQGKKAEAAAIATRAYADALNKASSTIDKDMGHLESFFKGIAEAATSMWNAILNIGRKGTLTNQLDAAKKELEDLKDSKWFNGGIGGVYMTDQYRKNAIQVQEAVIAGIEKEIAAQKKLGDEKEANNKAAKKIEEDIAKRQAMGGFTAPKDLKLEELKTNYANTIKDIDAESNKLLAESKNRYALGLSDAGDFLSEELILIKNQNDKKLAENTKYLVELEKARATQEAKIRAEGARAIFVGGAAKSDAETKKMKDAIDQLNASYKNLAETVKTSNSVIADKSVEQQTKALDLLGQYTKKVIEGSKEFARTLEDTAAKRKLQIELENQLAGLSGGELARVKAQIDAEQNHITKLSELQDAALKAGVYLSKLRLSGLDPSDPKYKNAADAVLAANDELEQAKSKSRQEIVQAGIDAEMLYYTQEYNKLKASISDALVTALFEGGKIGSKKLRDILIAELKKPINVVVNAIVNTLMGSSSGSSGGSIVGNFASSMLSKAAGNISIGGGSLAAAGEAFGTGFMTTIQGGSVAEAAGAYSAAGMQGVSTGLSAGAQLATAVPYVAAAVIALNALGAFRTTKQVGGGISGTLGEGDINSYATMRKSGTLFRGPSYWRENRGEFSGSDALQATFADLKNSTSMMAEAIGKSSDDIAGYTKKIEISFDGLTDAQIQDKIATTFKDVGNELAALVLGAGATAEQLSSLYNNIMQQRYDLETKLLELQGDTVALRERERAKIYETNKALFDQIAALEDKKAADEEAAKAAAEYSQQITAATKSVTDEINRLRGVNTSQTGLESQFAILTAQARAGDLEALAKLPTITQGLEQIAGATAINATDIVLARARLAQSLQDTLGYVGANGFSASAGNTSVATLSSISSVSATGSTATVSAAASNQELLAALIAEMQGLRSEVRADVTHNAKTAKILERANQDGETLSVSATIDGGVV